MIRVLSAEITQDYGRMFINELHYHLIETKEALKLGWKDIEEELFYLKTKNTYKHSKTMKRWFIVESLIDSRIF